MKLDSEKVEEVIDWIAEISTRVAGAVDDLKTALVSEREDATKALLVALNRQNDALEAIAVVLERKA